MSLRISGMHTPNGDPKRDMSAISLLTEPTRRALYEFVSSRNEPVGRDEAGREVGVARGLAAFHLDRLVAAGLLEASFANLSGRRGPGSGRPAKLYNRSKQDFDVSVPTRDYQLPAHILSDVVAARSAARDRAIDRARHVGVQLGTEARRSAGSPLSRSRIRGSLHGALREQGFEPEADGGGRIRLRNCPFSALAKEHADLICGMNHALIRGLVEGLRVDDVEAVLDPAPDRCCVRLVPGTAP
jgi:predicted ArsR family transcriptional regulator